MERPTGIETDRKGSIGIEMTGVPGYVVDFTLLTSPSHGGDGGSKPPGTTSNIKHLCISWSGTRWVLFPFCSHFSDPAARTCWVLFCPRKPYLGFSMVESHQIDGLGKLLVADASITFTYASRLRTVAKDTLLNLRVHS